MLYKEFTYYDVILINKQTTSKTDIKMIYNFVLGIKFHYLAFKYKIKSNY